MAAAAAAAAAATWAPISITTLGHFACGMAAESAGARCRLRGLVGASETQLEANQARRIDPRPRAARQKHAGPLIDQ